MDFPNAKVMDDGMLTKKWVILQSCHLNLEFMGEMEERLNPKNKLAYGDFRLWITCQPCGSDS